MNDQDLERELRSQRSPREDGYAPTRLPMTLDEAPAGRSGPAPLVRGGLFAGAVVAGVLAVAVVAAMLSGPGDRGVGVGKSSASPSAEPSGSSTTASEPASPAACVPDELRLEADPWGGAAGSRGTIVTVSGSSGTCALDADPLAHVSDVHGTVLVSNAPGTGDTVTWPFGRAVNFAVTWSNWCGAAPDEPISLWISFEGAAAVPVTVPAGGDDPVPPCSGDAPSTLSVTLLGVVQ
jgi:hypothetical protein